MDLQYTTMYVYSTLHYNIYIFFLTTLVLNHFYDTELIVATRVQTFFYSIINTNVIVVAQVSTSKTKNQTPKFVHTLTYKYF